MKTILHFHLIIISSVLLSVDSCKSKQETATGTSATTTTAQQNTAATASTPTVAPVAVNTATTTPKDENARFIASFYSIGQGIDSKTNEEFVKLLESYQGAKKINYEAKHWGREGEIEYCLALKELTPVEQEEFVRKARKILSYNVNVNENASPKNKGASGQAEEKYRLIVSFFSIGEGINLDVQEKFEKFLAAYSPKVKHEAIKWGREGELEYCLKLSELSTTQQEEFVMKTKDIASKRVHISENEKCKR